MRRARLRTCYQKPNRPVSSSHQIESHLRPASGAGPNGYFGSGCHAQPLWMRVGAGWINGERRSGGLERVIPGCAAKAVRELTTGVEWRVRLGLLLASPHPAKQGCFLYRCSCLGAWLDPATVGLNRATTRHNSSAEILDSVAALLDLMAEELDSARRSLLRLHRSSIWCWWRSICRQRHSIWCWRSSI